MLIFTLRNPALESLNACGGKCTNGCVSRHLTTATKLSEKNDILFSKSHESATDLIEKKFGEENSKADKVKPEAITSDV